MRCAIIRRARDAELYDSFGIHQAQVRPLLVTGHTGFVGRTVRAVLNTGDNVRWSAVTLPDGLDIRSSELCEHIADLRPAAVLHLAGLTSVAESFADPERFFDVNFNGTWNLLKALRAAAFTGRFLFVSSGDCYGAVADADLPVRETHPLRPRSPYAVSKIAAESLCYQWAQTERLDIILTRSFNHLGPGQDVRFAAASFARQVVSIRNGTSPPRIVAGDLGITRDLTDVRDVVRAYLSLLDSGRTAQVYNVGSGRETRLAEVLSTLTACAGITAEIVTDPSRVRSGEQRRAVADVAKIHADTGWSAATPLARTLADMLDDWSERIRHE
jgi:GDP-4-dehydro-6-deoxy-D-mannose reductase